MGTNLLVIYAGEPEWVGPFAPTMGDAEALWTRSGCPTWHGWRRTSQQATVVAGAEEATTQ
ncbi:MAG: hypothetical protein RMK65_02030, partial [Anaerolineae bacterium]|nr:hypothetical protein [Anaerolineae bacterium]